MKPEVAVEDVSAVEKKLKITVPPDMTSALYGEVLQEYVRKAQLPGFRPGKAPSAMVQKQFGDRITREALERVVNVSYRMAISEVQLYPLGEPDIRPESNDFTPNQAFSYLATFEVPPKLTLKKYKGLKAKVSRIVTSDDDVKQYLENMQKRSATFVPLEGRKDVRVGDFAIMDFSGTGEDGQPIEQASGQDYQVEVGSKSLIEGLEDGLVGMNIGDTRQIPVTFPKDYFKEDLQGKKATFLVNLKEVKRRELPEMNEEWVKKMGPHSSLEEMKQKIKEDMDRHNTNHFEDDLRGVLREALVAANDVPLPKSLVAYQYKALVQNLRERMEREHVPEAKIQEGIEKNTKELQDAAEFQVKATLIMREIARQENLTVTDEDIDARLKKWATDAETTVERIRELAHEKGWIDSLRQELLDEKVYGFLKGSSNVEEVPQSAKDHHH